MPPCTLPHTLPYLPATYRLQREKVTNVICLDENPAGLEGPWITYARMVTLRTPKALTGLDYGMPSLTFQVGRVDPTLAICVNNTPTPDLSCLIDHPSPLQPRPPSWHSLR